jgi:hypothetical protein
MQGLVKVAQPGVDFFNTARPMANVARKKAYQKHAFANLLGHKVRHVLALKPSHPVESNECALCKTTTCRTHFKLILPNIRDRLRLQHHFCGNCKVCAHGECMHLSKMPCNSLAYRN